jgi:tRNA(fMet)-specific endonuclease VapC
MILLDTDILTLLLQGHDRVQGRLRSADDDIAITIVSWLEVMQGRFDALFKAADARQLVRAQQRLEESTRQLGTLSIVPIDEASAREFAELLKAKKLKRIGRGDLLIASIALARKATLITRNLRDFQLVAGLKSESWAD